VLEWLWNRKGGAWEQRGLDRSARYAICVLAAAALATTAGYLQIAWHIVAPWPDYTARVEYRVADWVWSHLPDARVMPAGSVRFWFDTWHDLAQPGGGSEQGLLNPVVPDAEWEVAQGADLAPAVLWLKALGVDAIYVAGPKSQETYKDYAHKEKFSSLAVLYDDGQDNRIFRIPRRYPARVRVVEAERLNALIPWNDNADHPGTLRDYVDILENGPDSAATLEREGTDAMRVRAEVKPGQALVVQESWDPAWQAWSGGRRLPVQADALGFMRVDAPPGRQEILLRFATPFENQVGRVLTVLSLGMALWLLLRRPVTP
jgi:hypothetical protein